jgi:hypothetical protein
MKFVSAFALAAILCTNVLFVSAPSAAAADPSPAADQPMPACAASDPVVWENTKKKVYHLKGDKYYGTTKHGVYACKSAADSAGFHLAKSGHHGTKTTVAPSPAAS